jgi:hypothetical protein
MPCFWNKKKFGSYDFLKTYTFYALQDYRKVCEVLKNFTEGKHEKNTFIFIYVTSQKSGFEFPRATSRQSHEGSRVYMTTQFKKKTTRATSTTRAACSTTNLARRQNFRDTDLKL